MLPCSAEFRHPRSVLGRWGVLKGELRITCRLDLDHKRHSPNRIAERELFSGIFARNFVHDLEFGIVAKLDDASADLYFLVRIAEIDHRERQPRIAPQIAYLETGLASTDQDVIVAHSDPHRCCVWVAVRH